MEKPIETTMLETDFIGKESRQFSMGAFSFLVSFIFRYAWIWIISLSLLSVAALVAGISIDIRWLLIGLMIITVLLPMLFAFLYYYYGLKRECFVNTVLHTLSFEADGININLLFIDKENEEMTKRTEFFSYSDLQPFWVGSHSVTIPLKKPLKGFIWIPEDAFENTELFADALQYLSSKTENKDSGLASELTN